MTPRAFFLHALSPLHAGTGQGVDVIDLPIARMRSTGIPLVPGSTVKGVLRDQRRNALDQGVHWAVFGPDSKGDPGEHAGALVIGDARLLALPVRTFKGTFAWVSSPLLLELARRDLIDGATPDVPASLEPLEGPAAQVGSLSGAEASLNVHDKHVYLEDLDLPVQESAGVAAWGEFLSSQAAPGGRGLAFMRRFVVVDDETMTFLQETATQVDTRIRLESETRTVARGALWVEESLPPETLLIGLALADRSRRRNHELQPSDVLNHGLGQGVTVLQVGGKATVGRGRVRLIPVAGGVA